MGSFPATIQRRPEAEVEQVQTLLKIGRDLSRAAEHKHSKGGASASELDIQ